MADAASRPDLNRLAGKWLRAVQEERDLEQKEFAAELTKVLGYELKPSALSNYESGKRPVPAAVMLAGSLIANRPIFVDPAAEESFVVRIVDIVLERLKAREAGIQPG